MKSVLINPPPSDFGGRDRTVWWKRVARAVPAFLWISGILVASGEAMSHGQTSQRFYPFFRKLIPGISEEAIDVLHFIFRKGGHVAEYAILASLIWFAVGNARQGARKGWLVWGLTVACAALDEYRQSFTPSRGASVGDVAIDAVGAAFGIFAVIAVGRLWKLFRKRA